MDVWELIGGVICTGIPGPRLDAETANALERLKPSGVVLFRRNFENVGQLKELTSALHSLPSAPLVSIDHEGGRVIRLGAPFTQFPPAGSIMATGDPQTALAVGRAMGRELASVGIDLSYAPVLDVSSNPANPIIGDRAFGNDVETVIGYALPFKRGLQESGIIPCGKHFPGHGDTDRDSHLELPIVRRSLAELEATELAPFRAAIAARIPVLMTAHVVYAALDHKRPATLSRRIVDGLLRQEMGFAGVTISDDLEMRAISAQSSVADAALDALHAGIDWLLICNDFAQTQAVAARLTQAIESGTLDPSVVAAAAARIRGLTEQRPRAADLDLPAPEHETLNQRIRTAAFA